MAKDYSNITNPVMVYKDDLYAVIEADSVDAALAAGWSATPLTDINVAPKECLDTLVFDAPVEKKGKK